MKFRLIIFIIGLTLLLQIIGINYGFPFAIGHFDEIFSIRQAISFGATRSLRPIMFEWPSFYSYVLFFIYGIWFLLGKLFGVFQHASDFAFIYIKSPGVFYVIARAFNVMISTLTVFLVYTLGKKLYNKSVGLLAASLLCFSPFYILHSHWALVDTLMSFLSMCSFIFLYKFLYQQEFKFRNYLLAGFFIGLATATKFNAAVLIMPFLIAYIISKINSKDKLFLDRRLFLGFIMIILGFFIGSPYCILSLRKFYEAFLFTRAHNRFGYPGKIVELPWIWLGRDLLITDLIIGFIFIVGTIYCIFRKNKNDWLFLSVILLFYAFTSQWRNAALKYATMILPCMALMGASMLYDVHVKILKNRKIVSFVGLSLIFIFPLLRITKDNYALLQKDTRIQAKEWVEANIPENSKIAMYALRYRDNPAIISNFNSEFYTFDYGTKAQDVFSNKELEGLLSSYLSKQKTYRLYKLERELEHSQLLKMLEKIDYKDKSYYLKNYYGQSWYDIEKLKQKLIDYVLLSSFHYEGYTQILPSKSNPLYLRFSIDKTYFDNLMNSKDTVLIKEFKAHSKIEPTIKIYKLVYN